MCLVSRHRGQRTHTRHREMNRFCWFPSPQTKASFDQHKQTADAATPRCRHHGRFVVELLCRAANRWMVGKAFPRWLNGISTMIGRISSNWASVRVLFEVTKIRQLFWFSAIEQTCQYYRMQSSEYCHNLQNAKMATLEQNTPFCFRLFSVYHS